MHGSLARSRLGGTHVIASDAAPIKSKVLLVEEGLALGDTAPGRRARGLQREPRQRDGVTAGACSFENGLARVASDAGIHAVLLGWQVPGTTPGGKRPALVLLKELHTRHPKIPVVLAAETDAGVRAIDESVMALVSGTTASPASSTRSRAPYGSTSPPMSRVSGAEARETNPWRRSSS